MSEAMENVTENEPAEKAGEGLRIYGVKASLFQRKCVI